MYLLMPALFFLQVNAFLKSAHQFGKRQDGPCASECNALNNFGPDCLTTPNTAECNGCRSDHINEDYINEIATCYGCLGDQNSYQQLVDSLVQSCDELGFNIPNPNSSSNNSPSTPSSSTAASSTPHAAPSSQSATVKNTDPSIGYYPPNAWSTVSGTSNSASLNVPSCSDSGQLKESSTKGSNISYSFVGSGIAVHTVTSSLGGAYTVSIDGSSPQALDDYNPSAAATSPTCSVPFTVASLNPNGHHTIVIQFTLAGQSPNAAAAGALSAGQLDFDAFVVTTSVSTSSAQEFGVGGPVSLLAFGLVAVVFANGLW